MTTGRRRKPSNLRYLHGDPGKRAPNTLEPKPEEGRPKPPDWLSRKAKIAWAELADVLEEMHVLTVADRRALELLCDAYSEWREARAIVDLEGETYETTTAHGSTVRKAEPAVAIAADAWRRVRAMLAEFGLTPAARSKVSTVETPKKDPFEDWRSRRRGKNPRP
jgi:P27 family predicted phage terminase small subunit